MSKNEYQPDYVSPPGESLQELLDERNINRESFCHQINWSEDLYLGVLSGEKPIERQMAQDLERVLGVPALFWLQRQLRYDEWKIKE